MYRSFNKVFHDFDYLQREINNIFNHAYRGSSVRQTFPLVNLYENGDEIRVIAELPGVSKDNVDISLLDKVLTLSGQREAKRYGEKVLTLRQERATGEFKKQIKIPVAINVEAITANFTDGLLTVVLPKAEEAKPRKIEIQKS